MKQLIDGQFCFSSFRWVVYFRRSSPERKGQEHSTADLRIDGAPIGGIMSVEIIAVVLEQVLLKIALAVAFIGHQVGMNKNGNPVYDVIVGKAVRIEVELASLYQRSSVVVSHINGLAKYFLWAMA